MVWSAQSQAARTNVEDKLRRYASDLRGPFATALYREMSKIRLVQKPLGRSDLSITMVYTYIFDEQAERALKSFRKTMAVAA